MRLNKIGLVQLCKSNKSDAERLLVGDITVIAHEICQGVPLEYLGRAHAGLVSARNIRAQRRIEILRIGNILLVVRGIGIFGICETELDAAHKE